MAEIWKARARLDPDGTVIAIKRILPHLIADRQYVAMFLDESRLLADLDHPSIVRTLDVGAISDTPYIALEFVFGQDGRALIGRARRGFPTPIRIATFIMMRVCEALHYAHEARDASGEPLGLVHRDVSLQNVLLSYAGDVKLTDFGIARSAQSSARTQAGIVKGNLGYMSPEQLRGAVIDRRSDVFAAGVCLYELLTNERLFGGANDYAAVTKMRYAVVPPPSQLNREIPPRLDDIVMRALSKRPEERFETAHAFAAALRSSIMDSDDDSASADALGRHLRRVFADAFTTSSVTPGAVASSGARTPAGASNQEGSGSDVFELADRAEQDGTSGLTDIPSAKLDGPLSDVDLVSATSDSSALSGALTPIQVSRIQPVRSRAPEPVKARRPSSRPPPEPGAPAAQPELPTTKRPETIAYGPVIGAVAAIIAVIVVALAVNLRNRPAEVRVTVIPKDASISVDGQMVVHNGEVVIHDLEPGVPHRIAVMRRGYQSWTTTLSLQAGKLLPLPTIHLVPISGLTNPPAQPPLEPKRPRSPH